MMNLIERGAPEPLFLAVLCGCIRIGGNPAYPVCDDRTAFFHQLLPPGREMWAQGHALHSVGCHDRINFFNNFFGVTKNTEINTIFVQVKTH